jgi:condensin complex subunit 3
MFSIKIHTKKSAISEPQEVRKNILLSIPASNSTVNDIVAHTADVSESVRKTAFFVLSNKFPIQSLRLVCTLLHAFFTDKM